MTWKVKKFFYSVVIGLFTIASNSEKESQISTLNSKISEIESNSSQTISNLKFEYNMLTNEKNSEVARWADLAKKLESQAITQKEITFNFENSLQDRDKLRSALENKDKIISELELKVHKVFYNLFL